MNMLSFIEKLRNESFEGWTEEAKGGYLTALKTIEEKIKEIESEVSNLPDEFYRVNEYLGKQGKFDLLKDMQFVAMVVRQLRALVNNREWYKVELMITNIN